MELLEDGVHLVDSLVAALERTSLSTDDHDTLHEALLQLPALDEALTKLSPQEEARALTDLFTERRQRAVDAVTRRLGRTPPSLRDGVVAVVREAPRQFTPPRPEETRLFEHADGGALWSLVGGAAVGAGVGALLSATWAVPAGVLAAWAGWRWSKRPAQWALLPDRFVRWGGGSTFGFTPDDIGSVRVQDEQVVVELSHDITSERTVTLRHPEAAALASTLRLLRSPWLAGLASAPRPFVLVGGVDDETQKRGRVLVGTGGLLFVADDAVVGLTHALSSVDVPTLSSVDQALRLVAHLDAGRWPSLAAHLATTVDARWIPREALRQATTQHQSLSLTLSGPSMPTLRLAFSLPEAAAVRQRLEGLAG